MVNLLDLLSPSSCWKAGCDAALVLRKGRWAADAPSGFLHGANKRCDCSRCNLDFVSAVSDTNSSSGTDHVSLLGSQVTQAANLCKSLLIPEFVIQKACVCCSQSSYLQCNRSLCCPLPSSRCRMRVWKDPWELLNWSLPLVQLSCEWANATKN